MIFFSELLTGRKVSAFVCNYQYLLARTFVRMTYVCRFRPPPLMMPGICISRAGTKRTSAFLFRWTNAVIEQISGGEAGSGAQKIVPDEPNYTQVGEDMVFATVVYVICAGRRPESLLDRPRSAGAAEVGSLFTDWVTMWGESALLYTE